MQIVAMGGHTFDDPAARALDRAVLDLARQGRGIKRPRVCFLGQASGEARDYLISFYRAYAQLDCIPSHLSLFQPHTGDIESYLMEQDAVFVGGGNTKSMLALWREWGLDRTLRAAAGNGTVLSGVSAGANCWFEWSTTDSIPDALRPLAGLGYLSGSLSPHYDGEAARRPTFQRLIADGTLPPGYGFDDLAAGVFIDGRLARVISARTGAGGYWVERDGDSARETVLATEQIV